MPALRAALACALLALAGCNRDPRVKLGFLVKQPEEPWFQLEWKFAEVAARDHGFELIKIGAADGEKVLAAIDTLAAAGAKGFVICPPDVRLGPAIVARAKSHDLKLVVVDDQFLGADGKPMVEVPYLGISARKIGEAVGSALSSPATERLFAVVRELRAAGHAVLYVTHRPAEVFSLCDAATVLLDGRLAAGFATLAGATRANLE